MVFVSTASDERTMDYTLLNADGSALREVVTLRRIAAGCLID